MEKVTLIGNLMTTLSVLFSSSLFLYILTSIFGFFVIKQIIKDNVREIPRKFNYIYSIIVLAIFILIYSKSLFEIWDKLMDHLFLDIYFPSLGIYMAIIIISIIILIVSIIKKKMTDVVKKINIISAASLIGLFFLILDTLVSNKIDMSSDMFLYTNNKLLALIEVSTGIFVLWMIALGVIYGIHKISNWFDAKEAEKADKVTVDTISNNSFDEPRVESEPTKNYSTLITNLLETNKTKEDSIKKEEERTYLINEYKQMREYLMQFKGPKNNNFQHKTLV